jgi:dUTP pyrophosphatase
MDLHAALAREVVIEPGARAKIPTGLAFSIPGGFEGQVRPRSGLAAKHGVTVLNAPGTVDADYRGEVQVVLVNHGSVAVKIAPLDRIAQLVIAPVARAELTLVAALDETVRGAGGYGSTGTGDGKTP